MLTTILLIHLLCLGIFLELADEALSYDIG